MQNRNLLTANTYFICNIGVVLMFLNKPKLIRVSEVRPEPVANAKGTFIRVLFPPEETPTYSMRVFEIEPQGHIPAHKHPWEHEIFVLEGEVKIKVGNEEFILEPETAIYIPPNIVHEYWNIGESKVRFICTIPNKPSVKS